MSDNIIRKVVVTAKKFHELATKNGVSGERIGRVETMIISHLKSWANGQSGECRTKPVRILPSRKGQQYEEDCQTSNLSPAKLIGGGKPCRSRLSHAQCHRESPWAERNRSEVY